MTNNNCIKTNNHIDIGILTFHIAYNYGAFLQAYALQNTVLTYSHNVSIIDYRPVYLTSPYSTSLPRYKQYKSPIRYTLSVGMKFVDNMLNWNQKKNREVWFSESIYINFHLSTEQSISYADLACTKEQYDLCVVGSDQIWSPNHTGGKLDPAYFFMYLPSSVKKYAYAASFGQESLPAEYHNMFKQYLSNIDKVSVRECSALPFITETMGKDAICVLDPTLLLTKDEWITFAKEPQTHPDKFMLVYNIAGSSRFLKLVDNISKQLNLKLIVIDKKKEFLKYLSIRVHVRPEEFVWYFANASFIVTDSFHGTMFSIINKKPFYSIAPYPQKTRIVDHLSRLGLLDRFYESPDDLKEITTDIDYDEVYKKLNKLREKSLDYLQGIINEVKQ